MSNVEKNGRKKALQPVPLVLKEALDSVLDIVGDIFAFEAVRHLSSLFVGLEKGVTGRTIAEVPLELLTEPRIHRFFNIVDDYIYQIFTTHINSSAFMIVSKFFSKEKSCPVQSRFNGRNSHPGNIGHLFRGKALYVSQYQHYLVLFRKRVYAFL